MTQKNQDNILTFGKKYKGSEEKLYTCGWCQYKFRHYVGTSGKGRTYGSTPVICPACGNGLKTWSD